MVNRGGGGANGQKHPQAFRLLCKEPRRASLPPFEPEPLQAPFAPQIPDRSFAGTVVSAKRLQRCEIGYHRFIVDGGDLEDSQLSWGHDRY